MKEESTFGWLFGQVGNKKGAFIFSIVTALINVICGLIPYYIVASIVEKLLEGEKDIGVYGELAVWMLFFYLLKVLFHEISTACSHKATFEILANIRKKCTDKLARMPLGDVLARPTGELKSTIIDRVDAIETTLAHIVPEFTTNLVAPLIILISIFIINWKMGFATMITLPLGFLCFMGMMIGYDKNYGRVLKATKALNDTAVEYINGIEVIKVFGKAESSYKKFVDTAQEGANSYIQWMKKCNVFFTFSMVLMPATMLTVLPIGAIMTMKGAITMTDMIIIIIYSVALIDPIITIMSYNDDIKKAGVIVKEVQEILNAPELKRPETLAKNKKLAEESLILTNVHFSYQKEEILHGINMNIAKGEYAAIVGPSGSGKSTIAKLIAGMWDVNEGAITVGGIDIREIPFGMYQDKIAYVSQDNYLFNETVRDNIRMGKVNGVATDEEVEEVARRSGCHEFIIGLENGYDTIVGAGGGHLSGGERQRISIARAMLKDAPIVILDEATAYADPENEAVIQESVAKLVSDKTLIVIAHRLSTIMNADKIFCIKDGNVYEEGTHQELIDKNGLYKKMWDAHISSRDKEEEKADD